VVDNDIATNRMRGNKSYARRIGRSLTTYQRQLADTVLSELDALYHLNNCKTFGKLALEIGFGNGSNLLKLAQTHKDVTFIGCEPFINGVAKLLKQIVEEGIKNIRIHADDIKILLAKIKRKKIFEDIYILFPDPWPKKRHDKRRLITQEFIELLISFLKDNGQISVATDDKGYASWIKKELGKSESSVTVEYKLVENSTIACGESSIICGKFFMTKYAKRGISNGQDIHVFFIRKLRCSD